MPSDEEQKDKTGQRLLKEEYCTGSIKNTAVLQHLAIFPAALHCPVQRVLICKQTLFDHQTGREAGCCVVAAMAFVRFVALKSQPTDSRPITHARRPYRQSKQGIRKYCKRSYEWAGSINNTID